MMRKATLVGLAGAAAAVGGVGVLTIGDTVAQAPTAPKARYWMDAETIGGIAAAGANPMAMLMGRGGGAQHSLVLRLGSTLPASGAPKGDHFMPPNAKLGPSVPLETPVTTASEVPQGFERPKGRLRIFWGCGAHAGPGQPIVIDFAKVAAGQFPPNVFTTSVPVEQGPTKSNSRTYGTWPNSQKTKTISASSSLLGAHRIAANYSPEINFTLNQDFMPPLRARGADAPGGAIALSWEALPSATGYYAMAMGGGAAQGGGADVVWWASSATQQFGGGLAGWLSPATVARLIGQKVIMPPTQTSCTVPAEVKAAAGQAMMTMLTAYGPEADFVYPPRPADPKTPWRPEWTAKARFRSTTAIIPGLDMGAAMSSANEDEGGQRGAPPSKKKCKKPGGLGGMLGGALGVPSGC